MTNHWMFQHIAPAAIGILLVSFTSHCAVGAQGDAGIMVNSWTARAEAHARKMPNASSEDRVWDFIAGVYAQLGRYDLARSAVAHIADPKLRAVSFEQLTEKIAELGDWKSARDMLNSIQDRKDRNRSLSALAEFAIMRHCFREAQGVIDLISDSRRQDEERYMLALGQAHAGNYDAAVKTASALRASDKEEYPDGRTKADLLDFIAECRESKKRDKPARKPETIYESIRDMGGAYDAPSGSALKENEDGMRYSPDPLKRTYSGYLLARAYRETGNAESRDTAIRKATQALPNIRDDYQRLLTCTLIAQFLVETGERDQAGTLAKNTLTRKSITEAFGERDDYGLAPKIVSLFVRLGELPTAFEMAQLAKGAYSGDAWWALGAACALEDRIGDAEKMLTQIGSEKHKALFCTGVAAGLCEARQLRKKVVRG